MNKKLADEALEVMLKSVASDAEDRIVEDILNRLDDGDVEFSNEHVKNMQKVFRKEYNKTVFKKLLSYSKRTAALILVTLAILGISVVSVRAWRVKVLNFIIESKDTHSYIKINESNENNTENTYISDDINLGYIPDGFTLEHRDANNSLISLEFVNGESYFRLTRNNISVSMYIDTEDAETKNLLINGREAFLSMKNNVGILVWYDDDFAYRLTGNILEKEMILIAENKK